MDTIDWPVVNGRFPTDQWPTVWEFLAAAAAGGCDALIGHHCVGLLFVWQHKVRCSVNYIARAVAGIIHC